MDDEVVLCGAVGVDYVEFDVWREIQEQVSNKLCHDQRPTWLEKQKGAIAKYITDFLQKCL